MGGVIYLLVFSLGVIIQSMSHCHGSITTGVPENEAALFVFGDSLFDIGNNNYINTTTSFQANYPPYGETFFKYPSGRFSDGRMIPDVIAELAKLPLLPPYLHPGHPEYINGVNFASGGSGALRETSQGLVIDLKTQASYFKKLKNLISLRLGHVKAQEKLSKSVYLFSVGSNDYGSLIDSNSGTILPVNHQQFVNIVIGNLSDVIKEIYNLGGKKFGFYNVGPIDCVPAVRNVLNKGRTGPCFGELSAIARLHNIALSKMLREIEKQLKGFKYAVNDFYAAYSELLKHPSKYGFKEVSVGCCGGGAYRGDGSCGGNKGIKKYELCDNVKEYAFFDSNHPTDSASQHFAELIWSGNRTVTSPYNLQQLFEL